MRFHTRIVVVLVLAMLACLRVAGASASGPDTINHPDAGPPGIYVFYDWNRVDPKLYPIVGGEMSFTWKSIESSAGRYNWGNVDKFVSDVAAQGKRAGLRITSYDGQCCGGSGVPDFYKISAPNIVLKCNTVEIPRYWDPSYKDRFGKLINAFGVRYNKDSRVAWIEISSGIFGETAPAEDEYDACLQGVGLSTDMWVSTVNWSTDLYRGAFPNKQLLLQFAPRFLNRSERRQFTDYAAARGVGLKHNGLKPDGTGDAFITDLAIDAYKAGQYDPIATWGDRVPVGFEGSESSVSMEGRTNTMWSIYNALDKRTDFLALDTAVTTAPDRQDLLQFASEYLGKRLPDIPSAWVALRETEFDWFPDYGNYEFYLTQNDAAPGGKTVALSKVDATAEGRYTRRTNQATGNPNMYFDLDDNYAYGSVYNATFTVTYLNKGTDKWELRYDAIGNSDKLAGTITKTNSGKWQKASFKVVDATFANSQPGGSDFRINSLSDGDETIHMMDVAATPGKPKTVRFQPGVDGYDGLRDTYLTSWYPDKNTGTENKFWIGSPDKMYGLLRFDLPGLPSGSKIVTATLGLYQTGGSSTYATELKLDAHRMLRSWDETGATWNKATSLVAWQMAGATGPNDREAAASASNTTNQMTGWAELNITSMAQAWSDAPSSNYGVWLKGTSGLKAQFYFYSREHTDPALRPWLKIDYYEPVSPPSTRTPTPTFTKTATPTSSTTPKPGTATPTRTATASATPTATSSVTPSPTPTLAVRSLTSRQVTIPPAVDGNLGEWAQPEVIQVKAGTADTVTFQANPTSFDISADVRGFWDAEYLYFAASVADDKIYTDSSTVWDDDSIEFAIDGANDQVAFQADDHQFTVTADGRLTDLGSSLAADVLATFKVAARQRAGGYDVELAIPRKYLAAGSLDAGKLLGFTVGLNDDDDGGKRDGANDNHLVWEGASTNSAPAEYGKLALGALYGSSATQTPTATLTPSSTPTQTRTPTPTFTATATSTPSRTITTTATNTPTVTPTQTDTSTATPTLTATSTQTYTPSPTLTATPTSTPSRTMTPTATNTSTLTPTQTGTPTATATNTVTPQGRVGGRVWLDRNGNGLPDAGEPGVTGLELTLSPEVPGSAPDGGVRIAFTTGNGNFEFGGVAAGRHVLALVELPSLQCTTAREVNIEVADSPVRVDATFGIKPRSQNRIYLPTLWQN